jgi:hypothetical protein
MMVMVIPASPLTDTAARRVLRCIAPVYSLAVIVRRFAVCLLLRPCRLRRSRRRPLQVQPDGAVITTAKAMAILTVTENLRCLDAVHQLRGYQREVDTHALAIVLRADPPPHALRSLRAQRSNTDVGAPPRFSATFPYTARLGERGNLHKARPRKKRCGTQLNDGAPLDCW